MIFRNVAGQRLPVVTISKTTGLPVPGRAATLSCRYDIDAANSFADLDDDSAVEGEGGVCFFDLLQAETDGDLLVYITTSSDPDVVVQPWIIYTDGGVCVGVDDGTYTKMGNAGTDAGQPRGKDTDSLDDQATSFWSKLLSEIETVGSGAVILSAVKTLTDKIDNMLALNGEETAYQFTIDSLENGPSGTVSAPTAAAIRAEIDANSTRLAAIIESLVSNHGETLAQVLTGLAASNYGIVEIDEETGEFIFKLAVDGKEILRGTSAEDGTRSAISKDLD